MPGLSFKYPASALVGVSAGGKDPDEKNVLLGELNSTEMLNSEYRFEAGAGLPIPCRASIVRLVFMKLLGTGILAAISGDRCHAPLVSSRVRDGVGNAFISLLIIVLCLCSAAHPC